MAKKPQNIELIAYHSLCAAIPIYFKSLIGFADIGNKTDSKDGLNFFGEIFRSLLEFTET